MNKLKWEDISEAYRAAEPGAPLERELGAALTIIDGQERSIDVMTGDIDSLELRVDELEQDLAVTRSERDDLASDVDYLSSQVAELESELEEARA